MTHFDNNNTDGYTAEQLVKLNEIISAKYGDDRPTTDEYKRDCENALKEIDNQ